MPDGVVHAQPDEPAKQQVVFELLHQHPLAANRVERLEQERTQQVLRWNRRAAHVRIHPAERRRQRRQGGIRQPADGSKRMVSGNPLLRREIAEELAVLLMITAHAKNRSTTAIRCRSLTRRFFSSLLL